MGINKPIPPNTQITLDYLVKSIEDVYNKNKSLEAEKNRHVYSYDGYNRPLISLNTGVLIICHYMAYEMYGSYIDEAMKYSREKGIEVEKLISSLPDTTAIIICPKYI